MSYSFRNAITNSFKNVKYKYKHAKQQFENYELELKYKKSNNMNYGTPDYIKNNPFYIGNLIKTKFYETFKFLFECFKNKPKLLTQEDKFNIPVHIRKTINQVTCYTKNSALSIIDKANKLIVKLTAGQVDLFKIKNAPLIPIFKNVCSVITKNFRYENFIIFYKKMGNKINKFNQESMKNLGRFRNQKLYDEFQKKNENLLKIFNDKLKDKFQNKPDGSKNFFSNKFNKIYNNFISNTIGRSILSHNVKKINEFIESPWYKQKMSIYKTKFTNFFKEGQKAGGVMDYSYYKEKVNSKNWTKIVKKFNYTNARDFLRGGIKKKIRKIMMYIFSFFFIYYSIKYILHRVFYRRSDKNLEEALKAVKDLKMQNEELMKYNKDLIEKLVESKKK